MARSVGECDFSVQVDARLNFQFSAGENSFFGGLGHNEESPTDWWSSKFSMVLLCPPFSSLLPLFFDGKLSGSKYSRVCALYAEKEQQCLAAGVACRFSHEISS